VFLNELCDDTPQTLPNARINKKAFSNIELVTSFSLLGLLRITLCRKRTDLLLGGSS
jgi:hypothetical protein